MKAVPAEPIWVIDLFSPLRAALLELLRSLTDEQWHVPTVCTGWAVKDVAAHLLGDQAGLLSRQRDGWVADGFSGGWDELVAFVNAQNELWVQATRRLSPPMIIALLEFTGEMLDGFYRSLDPFELRGPVSWAGPESAPRWLDIAREYTEYWLHQQHIRDAVGRPGSKEKRLFAPVLDTFVRALPHTFRAVDKPDDTVLKLVISGDAGGVWYLVRSGGRWQLYREIDLEPACVVTLDGETAWRLFTKGISQEQARHRMAVHGDEALGRVVLNTVSIIA